MDARISVPSELFADVASKLLANDGDISCLRTNATLPHDAWIEVDKTIIQVAGQRLNGLADLRAYGLTRTLGGLGVEYDFWQTASDDFVASQNMSGITKAADNTIDFGENQIPIPITHVDFNIPVRKLLASQRNGTPLDTTQVAIATRKVIEALEDTLFNGSAVVSGGNSLPGYFNFTSSNEVALTGSWGTTPANIEKDVVKLIAANEADRMYGPYILYLHTDEWVALRQRDTTAGGISYLDILKSMPGIADVKPSDALANGYLCLVQMTSDVVSLATAVDIMAVEWDSHGGAQKNFKVMAAIAPRMMADYAGRCGIAFDNNMA